MSFSKKTLTSVIWSFFGGYVGIVVSFAGNLVLARVLFPEDFGIFALASSMFALLSMVTAFGSQESIIQCRDDNIIELIPTAFWIGIGISFSVFVIGISIGSIVFFSDSTLGLMFILLSTLVPINSLANSHASILKRTMNYKPLSLITTVAIILSFLLAIMAAVAGFGPWSLLIRETIYALVFWIAIQRISHYQLELAFNVEAAKWIWSFGWRKMFSQISEVVVSRYDKIVIGLSIGETQLGYYAQSYRLAWLGYQLTDGSISSVLFSMFSSVQSSHVKLSYAFERVTYWLIRTIPLMGLLTYLVGKPTVTLLYGEKWSVAGDYFQQMFVLMMFIPITSMLKEFLIGAGRIDKIVKIYLVQLVFLIVGVTFGALLGDIFIIIWAVNLGQVLVALLMIKSIVQFVKVKWLRQCFAPLVAFLLTMGFGQIVQIDRSSPVEWLVYTLGIGLFYGLLILLLDFRLLRYETQILLQIRRGS